MKSLKKINAWEPQNDDWFCPTPSVVKWKFLITGAMFVDKHKGAFSLVEKCRVTSWPCP